MFPEDTAALKSDFPQETAHSAQAPEPFPVRCRQQNTARSVATCFAAKQKYFQGKKKKFCLTSGNGWGNMRT